MSEPADLTLLVLREIREELRTTRTELKSELRELGTSLTTRIDETNEGVAAVETTLLDLAEQQRFVVRHLATLTARDRTLESEVDELRGRVDAIEKRLPG